MDNCHSVYGYLCRQSTELLLAVLTNILMPGEYEKYKDSIPAVLEILEKRNLESSNLLQTQLSEIRKDLDSRCNKPSVKQ